MTRQREGNGQGTSKGRAKEKGKREEGLRPEHLPEKASLHIVNPVRGDTQLYEALIPVCHTSVQRWTLKF